MEQAQTTLCVVCLMWMAVHGRLLLTMWMGFSSPSAAAEVGWAGACPPRSIHCRHCDSCHSSWQNL